VTARRAGTLLAAVCLAATGIAGDLIAQDSLPAPRRWELDTTRLAPFFRVYDIVVVDGDSATVIGMRTTGMLPGSFGATSGWRVVETRSGAVPAMDTLWLTPDARPLYWSSTLGPGRLTAQFVNDSLFGMVGVGRVQKNIVLPVAPNLLVTTTMAGIVVGALPIGPVWSDSASMLSIDPTGARTVGAELLVVARENALDVVGMPRELLVVSLRSDVGQLLFWLDAETRVPIRVQQQSPVAPGRRIEYRLREIPLLRLPLFWP
jgi:hypothetical protein